MFSTILKEVTGYFDRHALISAFFPSLVFWGGTLCLITGQTLGWKNSVDTWDKLPTTGQFLILFASFIWVVFWSFLTLNFQPFLLRLYEGYWPEDSNFVLRHFVRNRSQIYQHLWDKAQAKDRKLEKAQAEMFDNKSLIQTFRKQAPNVINTTPPTALSRLEDVAELINQQLIKFQHPKSWEKASSEQIKSAIEKLVRILLCWSAGHSLVRTESQRKQWRVIDKRLTSLTLDVEEWITQQLGIIEEKRHQHNRTQFLFLPPQRDDVLPTQLGNILKAAELYSQKRYNLDAVVIWSRLQTGLPEQFANVLQSSKISLDLMVTLSAFCLIFGIPLSVGLGLRAESWFLPTVPLAFGIAAFLMQQRLICWCALIAALLSVFLILSPDGQVVLLIRLQVLLTLISAVLWVSRLSYNNATQAALAYGEKLKAAFDLYRWKALEALNLKLPSNLSEERQLWDQVSKFLYRGYSDQLSHYQYQLPEKIQPLVYSSKLQVLVPKQALKAYERIEPSQLEFASIPIKEVPADAISGINEVTQRCPIMPIPSNTPLCTHHLIDHALIEQRFIVGIPATPSMTMNGTLQTGDRIRLTVYSKNGTPQTIKNIIVLNLISAPNKTTLHHSATAYTDTLTLAIPNSSLNDWQTRRKKVIDIQRY